MFIYLKHPSKEGIHTGTTKIALLVLIQHSPPKNGKYCKKMFLTLYVSHLSMLDGSDLYILPV